MNQPKPKVLIVDDRPENIFALQKLLTRLDVDIIAAAAGNDALGLTLEHEFSLAIVDVQMPEMDGYELVSLLRGNPNTASLPVIFVSAIYSDEYHHRKGYDAGAVDFLSKPFVPEILLSKVKVFLELYNQRRELQGLYTQVVRFNGELEEKVHERTAELERAYKTLEQLDRSKSDFITVLAHELRTPLSLVKGYAEMLRDYTHDTTTGLYDLQVSGIVNGAKRMNDIVNTMVDMIRIDTQVLEVLPERSSVAKMFSTLETEFREALKERRLLLVLQDLDALPDIQVDPDLLPKAFYHLLINAIKFTPDGGTITISGSLIENEGVEAIELVIRDTGIGIDLAYQELIFTKFYQTGPVALHSSGKTKFKGGGPGLGLAIVKGIVAAHCGRIWVVSSGHDEALCPGSAFHLVLPLKYQGE
ncbi:MAG: response regulator [Chloroflexi bacterium]|nr:response regulator [Chloroflexota bacterium]MBP8056698.1 response regulator [Chloroflexota bacterium]